MRRRRADEAGETLIELLVTIVILGTAATAIVAAVGISVSASAFHRKVASADVVARDYAEAVRLKVSTLQGSGWCVSGGPYAYTPPALPAQMGWSGSVVVTYGNCGNVVNGNVAYQTATVKATTSDGKDTETQNIVLVPNWCSPVAPATSC